MKNRLFPFLTLSFLLVFNAAPVLQTQAAFLDVSSSHENYEAIDYGQAQAILKGYPDGTYQPDKTIDRYEFTKIIVGAAFSRGEIDACKTSPFKDVPLGEWFTPYVCLAEKEGIIDGYPDGTFKGTDQIKLVEGAKIIVNGFEYSVEEDKATWYKPYILKLEELEALPVSLSGFEHQLTRGQMAEVAFRLKTNPTKLSTTYPYLELVSVGDKATSQEISKKARIYAETISDIALGQMKIYQEHIEALESVASPEEWKAVAMKHQSMLDMIEEAKGELEKVLAFLGEVSLKNVLIEHLDAMTEVLDEVYMEVSKTWENAEDSTLLDVQAKTAQLQELTKIIEKKAADSLQKVHVIQQAFASKFKFKWESEGVEPSEEQDDTEEDEVGLEETPEDPAEGPALDDGSVALDILTYFKALMALAEEATNASNDFLELISTTPLNEDYEILVTEREKVLEELQNIKTEVLEVGTYEREALLSDAALAHLEVMTGILENEVGQLMALRAKIADTKGIVSPEDMAASAQFLLVINEKLNTTTNIFSAIQSSFEEKYM